MSGRIGLTYRARAEGRTTRQVIAAIELARDGNRRTPFPWQERRGRRVYRHGLENGMLLRPLGDVVAAIAAQAHRSA